VFEETETEQGGCSLNVAACYPELADGLSPLLCSLDVEIARKSADWYELVDALTDVAIERRGQLLGSLVPSLRAWAALDIGDDTTLECLAISPLSTRSRSILQRNHLKTWGEVGAVSPGIIGGFVNAGVKVVRDVTRLVIELGAAAELGLTERHQTIVSSDGIPADGVTTPLVGRWVEDGPMQKLTAWGLAHSEATTLGEVLDLAASGDRVPHDVADAAAVVRALPLRELAVADPPSFAKLVRELLDELSDVQEEVLRRRVFTTSPVTLDSVGIDLAVTRERVRQIQVQAEERIEALLATGRFASVHWAAFTLHSALGSFAPVEAVARARPTFGGCCPE
jgi:hypothetical protein